MKRDFLMSELGLTKEVTDKIMAQYGESVNSLKNENKRLAEENTLLGEKVSGFDELSTRFEEAKSRNSELEESVGRLTDELKNSHITGAITSSLISAGAKNVIAAGALIDRGKIKVENDRIEGLSEQIEAVKAECSYLFYDGDFSSGMRHKSSQKATDGFTSFARQAAKLN